MNLSNHTACPDFFGRSSRWCWQLVSRAYTPMGKQTGLQLIQTIQPSAALVQIHPLVPFAPFLHSSVYKSPQLIQISFDKVTVVVLPSPHQWIHTIRNHIYTTRSGR